MRKIETLVMLVCVMSFAGCSTSAEKEKGNEKASANHAGEVIVLDKADFLAKVFNYEANSEKWVYEGDKPCIVDFYADWCGPCKKVSPILNDLASMYKNDIVIYKVNVDEEREIAGAFGIRSIPTLLFIPKEGMPQVSKGALPLEEFIKQIDGYLLGKN